MWLHYIWYPLKVSPKLIRSPRPLSLRQGRSLDKGGGVRTSILTPIIMSPPREAHHIQSTWAHTGATLDLSATSATRLWISWALLRAHSS